MFSIVALFLGLARSSRDSKSVATEMEYVNIIMNVNEDGSKANT